MLEGGNGGGEVALHCSAQETRDKKTFIGRVFKDEWRKGATSHQVDVENGAVVAIDVRVHGALLRCQTDSAVLQGERGVGRHVVPAAQKRDSNELCKPQLENVKPEHD